MKIKKLLAVVLSGVLAVGVLAGCGGHTGNGNVVKDGGRVRASVNDCLTQLDVEFGADRDFASSLATVANNVTLEDVKNVTESNWGVYLTGNAQATLTYVTKATWMESAPSKEGTYVCGLWFDGSMSAYDVGKAMATYLDMASAITESFDVSDAAVEAYQLKVGTGENQKEVWLAGVIVTLSEKSE